MSKHIKTILKIDSSARFEGSVSRRLSQRLTHQLQQKYPLAQIIERDVSSGIPLITEQWVQANFTSAEQRTAEQREILSFSDQLIEELKQADIVVLATPMYNFSVPAALKAYIDMICRAGVTFKYTENGPVGLLQNKQAYLVVATGGTAVHSEIDFVSDFVKHIFKFIGITDTQQVSADRLMAEQVSAIEQAEATIASLTDAA